jgi:Zn-dependent peptidase ImmA (M78 family)
MASNRRPSAIPFAKAAQLWETFDWKHPDALNLENLAMALGALILYRPLQSAEARLTRKGDRGIIRVRDDLEPPTRRRFAVAHELGHWQLHQSVSQLFVCTEADMIADYRNSSIEAEANSFASALLMPAHLFVERIRSHRPTFDELESLAAYFNTSLTATAIRRVDVSGDYCAVVVSRASRVKWWRGSDDFEDAYWINPGSALPRQSPARELTATCRTSSPVRTPANVWADERHGMYAQEFVEESAYFPRYDFTMTLISLP